MTMIYTDSETGRGKAGISRWWIPCRQTSLPRDICRAPSTSSPTTSSRRHPPGFPINRQPSWLLYQRELQAGGLAAERLVSLGASYHVADIGGPGRICEDRVLDILGRQPLSDGQREDIDHLIDVRTD